MVAIKRKKWIKMTKNIFDIIKKIPGIIEFIFSAFIYMVLYFVFGEIQSQVAKDTVCKSTHFSSQILCFFLTNPVMSFLITFLTVLGIGYAFRKKFL